MKRLLLGGLVALLAACGGAAATDDPGGASSTTAAGPATETTDTTEAAALPTEIPPGTVLRVGDQFDYLATVLGLAGEDQGLPYTVEYASFVGGPPMLQAFQAGAIDTGFVGSTPLIFAQAGGQDIVALAGWATERGGYDLVSGPGVDDIEGWDDLAGRTIAFQRGTAGQAAALQALDEAGLSQADVVPVDLPIVQTASALQSGAADVGLLVEPLTSVYLRDNPTARVVDVAELVTDRSSYLIASGAALADDGRTAALADYLARLVRSFTYLSDHRDQVAQAVYVETYGLPPERAAQIVEANGAFVFLDLPADVVDAQQHLADLFSEAGEIPAALDVTAEFDTRFNAVVDAARAG